MPASTKWPRAGLGAACVALAGLAGAAGGAPAQATPPPAPPSPVSLDGAWQLRMDPGATGIAQGWWRGGGTGWAPASVPGVFDGRPDPAAFHGTVGWYRLAFTGPSAPAGFAWALRFEQVRRSAQVWLNGRPVGGHGDPYTPFTLPASGLRPGAPNTLVVRVDNRKGTEPREGWWNWGGIVRPVSLVAQGPVVLDTPALLSQLRCPQPEQCHGGFALDGWVTNRSSRTQPVRLVVRLTPPAGDSTASATTDVSAGTLAPGQSVHVRRSLAMPGAVDLWEPGHPRLYSASIQTLAGGVPAQSDTLQGGLRDVAVQGGRLLLNGRPAQLSGASIEEDVPGRGPALTPADMDAIVSELRALHANVTRAQYPLSDELMARLDRAGILVWSQAPIYHRDALLVTAAQRSAALQTLRGTVLAARVHPAVIAYSVANELSPTPDTTPGTRAYLDAALALAHELDPTVPAALDILSYPGYPPQRTYRAFPLLGVNNYFGWYPGRAPHVTANLGDLAPYLQAAHRAYPATALVMTEFGAEATIAGPATRKQTFAFQSRYVSSTLGIVHSLPFMNGAIYWTLREFAVKPDWIGGARAGTPGLLHDPIHHKGLLSYAGQPKPAWAVAAAEFAATPLFRPLPAAPPALRTPSPATPWGSILILVVSLGGILALVALDVRMFLRIRSALRDDEWSAPVVPLRPAHGRERTIA